MSEHINQYRLLLDNRTGTEIDVELDGFASFVSYNGQTYKWSEFANKYLPIDAIKVKKVRSNNDPTMIDAADISALRHDINAVEGLSCSVRNRDGKQYLTVKSPSARSYEEIKRKIEPALRQYAPKAQHTSGGWGEHTYRLNPSER